MKTVIVSTLLAFGLNRAYACNEAGCELLAQDLELDFATVESMEGAPAGCVRFKNNSVLWVKSCNGEEDCDESTCTRCKLVNQQCAKKTFTFNDGAECMEGYEPITSRWEDCRDAAKALGVSDRSIKDVEDDFP